MNLSVTLGKPKEFLWDIQNNNILVIQRMFKNSQVPREDTYSKKELINILNFISKNEVVTLSNNVSKMKNAIDPSFQYDDYYKKGLGMFVYRNSLNTTKAQSTSQLISILSKLSIINIIKSRPLTFSLTKNTYKNLDKLFN